MNAAPKVSGPHRKQLSILRRFPRAHQARGHFDRVSYFLGMALTLYRIWVLRRPAALFRQRQGACALPRRFYSRTHARRGNQSPFLDFCLHGAISAALRRCCLFLPLMTRVFRSRPNASLPQLSRRRVRGPASHHRKGHLKALGNIEDCQTSSGRRSYTFSRWRTSESFLLPARRHSSSGECL